MKKLPLFVFAILLSIFGSCTPSYTVVTNLEVLHQYELIIVDLEDNPIEEVKIEYSLKDWDNLVDSGTFTTSSDGIFRKTLNVSSDPKYPSFKFYKSEFDYKISKDGYYKKSGIISSKYGTKYSNDEQLKKEKITLIRPVDYLNKEFASSLSDVELKTRILKFIDLIILQGIITESVLETQSIDLISFKDNNYLQFKFTNANVYNSLKLNKYDIGKRLFDEVIRKVLSPLNEYIARSNLFYGYDLTIIGYTKSFADEYAIAKPIEYRFIIPENIVREYKNKDISGQQVLDSSVILMDDERIELKLQ